MRVRHLAPGLLFLCSAIVCICSARATVPLEAIQGDLAWLKEQAQTDAQWRINQSAALAELLARQAAVPAQLSPDRKGAADWVAEADKSKVRDKLKEFAADSKFLPSLPSELRELAKKCILAGANATVAANSPNFELNDCDQSARNKLESLLKETETHAAVAYDRCRNVVLGTAPEYRDLVPANAHDSVTKGALAALEAYPNKGVKECAQEIKSAVDQLKDVKDAKTFVSSSLVLASNVCFASGGNPWVCGAMLAIAFFMQMFDGSGGGKGDGPADGVKGGAAGGQGVPAVNAGPPREGDPQGQARQDAAQKEIQEGPATNFGPSANLGSPNVTSNAYCNGASDQIVCFLKGVKDSDRYFFGDQRIADIANAPRAGAVTVCGQDEVKAIVIPEGAQFRLFGHNDTGSTPAGLFKSAAAACAGVK